MAIGRTRRRKPDGDNVVSDVEPEEMEAEEVAEEPEVVKVAESSGIRGPFRVDGCNIVDHSGRAVAMCGRRGDIKRTGPSIAAHLAELLNR